MNTQELETDNVPLTSLPSSSGVKQCSDAVRWTVFLRSVSSITALTILLVLASGCGEKAPGLSAEQRAAFDGASPEIKQAWDQALAADKANDYMAAQTNLDSLAKMNLNDAQRAALETETTSFGVRLMDAVDKNDPAAIKAVQEINQTRERRR